VILIEETRDLVRRGLASDRRRRGGRTDLGVDRQRLGPNRDMNTQSVRLPPAHVVQAEEPSARGLILTLPEDVRGQNYNTSIKTNIKFIKLYYHLQMILICIFFCQLLIAIIIQN